MLSPWQQQPVCRAALDEKLNQPPSRLGFRWAWCPDLFKPRFFDFCHLQPNTPNKSAQDRRLYLKVWTLGNYSSRDWEFSAISDSVWKPGSNQSALEQHGIPTIMGTKSELWQKLLVCSPSMFPLFFKQTASSICSHVALTCVFPAAEQATFESPEQSLPEDETVTQSRDCALTTVLSVKLLPAPPEVQEIPMQNTALMCDWLRAVSDYMVSTFWPFLGFGRSEFIGAWYI